MKPKTFYFEKGAAEVESDAELDATFVTFTYAVDGTPEPRKALEAALARLEDLINSLG